jgi:hypothetical protein
MSEVTCNWLARALLAYHCTSVFKFRTVIVVSVLLFALPTIFVKVL